MAPPASLPTPRFSKDQGQVDDLLPSCMFDALQSGFQVLGAVVLVRRNKVLVNARK